jgi:hypothetical protein
VKTRWTPRGSDWETNEAGNHRQRSTHFKQSEPCSAQQLLRAHHDEPFELFKSVHASTHLSKGAQPAREELPEDDPEEPEDLESEPVASTAMTATKPIETRARIARVRDAGVRNPGMRIELNIDPSFGVPGDGFLRVHLANDHGPLPTSRSPDRRRQ